MTEEFWYRYLHSLFEQRNLLYIVMPWKLMQGGHLIIDLKDLRSGGSAAVGFLVNFSATSECNFWYQFGNKF